MMKLNIYLCITYLHMNNYTISNKLKLDIT